MRYDKWSIPLRMDIDSLSILRILQFPPKIVCPEQAVLSEETELQQLIYTKRKLEMEIHL